MSPKLMDTLDFAVPETKLAFYSLLQYEPDPMRLERLNIAVLLEAPEYQYRGARVLRYMRKRLHCFDPKADAQVITRFARSIEDYFQSEPEDRQTVPIRYSEVPSADGLTRLAARLGRSRQAFCRLTGPKPILVSAGTTFEHELLRLFARLVAVDQPERDEAPKDKDFVRKFSLREFEARRVNVDTNPLPVRGEFFEENTFDALHRRDFSLYFQFLSFDTATSSLDQAKAFISARRDVGNIIEGAPAAFLAIVQPPDRLRTAVNNEAYERSRHYFEQAAISQVTVDPRNYELVAQGLQRGYDGYRQTLAS